MTARTERKFQKINKIVQINRHQSILITADTVDIYKQTVGRNFHNGLHYQSDLETLGAVKAPVGLEPMMGIPESIINHKRGDWTAKARDWE